MKRIVICLFFLCAVACLPGHGLGKEKKTLSLVAYNVGVFSKYDDDSMQDIANMMLELGADAVAVCEQDSCNRRHSTYQTKAFAEVLGSEWCYRYGSAMQWAGGSYGTAAVVSQPILDGFDIKIPKGQGYEPRVCVVAETAEYVIAAVHLDHSNEQVRMQQARLVTDELMKRYGRSRKPVFLCGDLNAVPDSQTLSLFSEDWTVLSEPAPTYPSQHPRECIDYILVLNNRARCEALSTAVCTEFETADVREASDHLPVYVDVRIR